MGKPTSCSTSQGLWAFGLPSSTDQAKTVMVGSNVSMFCSGFTTAYSAMSFENFSSQTASAGTGSKIGLVLWLSVASVEVLERDDDESANENLLNVRSNLI